MVYKATLIGNRDLPRNPFEVSPNFGALIGDLDERSMFMQYEAGMAVIDRKGERLPDNELDLALKRFEAVLKVRTAQLEGLSDEERADFAKRRLEAIGVSAMSAMHKKQDKNEIFADLFVRQSMRQVFTSEDAEKFGQDGMIKRQIVDSDLLSDHVLDSLGLSELKPGVRSERGWTYKHLQTEIRAEAVGAVKDMWINGMEELTLPQEAGEQKAPVRLFVITKGEKRGMVLVTKKETGKRRTFSVMDIHSAIRQLDHIRERYDESDLGLLAQLHARLEVIVERLDRHWNEVKDGNERAEIENELEEMGVFLSDKVRNGHKTKIFLQLQRRAKQLLRDSRGRINPGVACATLSDARFHAGERTVQVQGILRKHAENRAVLRTVVAGEDAAVSRFYVAVESGDVLTSFIDTPALQDDLEARRAEATGNLEALERRIARLKLSPYLALGDRVKAEIAVAKNGLSDGASDPEAVQKSLLRIYFIARMMRLEAGVQKLVDDLYYSNRSYLGVNPGYAYHRLHEMYSGLREHRHAPDQKMGDFYDFYVAVYEYMRDLMQVSAQAASVGGDEQVEKLEELERKMKDFSISLFMDKLPVQEPQTY